MIGRRHRARALSVATLAVLAVPASGLLAGRAARARDASRSAARPGASQPSASSRESVARANALFEEGRRLLEAGAVPAACDSFQNSNTLAPRGGTVLNLGLCRELQGDLPLARSALQEALARALRDGRADRVPIAREHLAAVEARLAQAADESLRACLASGEEMLARGLAASACATVQVAVADSPEAPALWRFLGRCHVRLRQVEQARACFRKYLALSPNAADAPFVQAIVQALPGDAPP